MRYTNYKIVFREIPDETTLAINISECPFSCPGCHTPELQDSVGDVLTQNVFNTIIAQHINIITCVCFMGGDAHLDEVEQLISSFKETFANVKNIKFGIYSGRDTVDEVTSICTSMDYVKTGKYVKVLGPINECSSNQKMYMRTPDGRYDDITHKMRRQNMNYASC